jgi:hypothetical protein
MTTRRKSTPDTEKLTLPHTEDTTSSDPIVEEVTGPTGLVGETDPIGVSGEEGVSQEPHPEASSEVPPVKEAEAALRPPALAKRLPSKNTPKFSLKIR